MGKTLEEIRKEAAEKISSSATVEALDEIRVSILGKKGELTQILKSMKDIAPEERPKVGQMVNEVRAMLEENIEAKKKELNRKLLTEKMKRETIDVTLPGEIILMGRSCFSMILACTEEVCVRRSISFVI